MAKLEEWAQKYGNGDTLSPRTRRVVVWCHDESTFYSNDRHYSDYTRWVHKSETANLILKAKVTRYYINGCSPCVS